MPGNTHVVQYIVHGIVKRFKQKLTKGTHLNCAIAYLHAYKHIYCKIIVNAKYLAINLIKHTHLIKHVDMRAYTENLQDRTFCMCTQNQRIVSVQSYM